MNELALIVILAALFLAICLFVLWQSRGPRKKQAKDKNTGFFGFVGGDSGSQDGGGGSGGGDGGGGGAG